jgi:sugar lactone lactonase YvrE
MFSDFCAQSTTLSSQVHHLNTETHQLETEQFEESVTCLVLREEKPGLVCATSSGFATLEDGQLRHLAQPLSAEHLRYVRFNDGASDAAGRFFAGTVCYREGDIDIPGQLWRYKLEDNSCVIVDEGPFTDSNGLGWSHDGKTFYFTDSLKNIIYAYDYDEGELSNRRVFIDALAKGAQENSFADGFCLDDEGGIWSARWGGSRIIRSAPKELVGFGGI